MRLRKFGSAILPAIACAAMFACIGAGTASAQKFQYEYGGDRAEAARGGVRAVPAGGYIAVGESFTPATGADIYLVRTNGDGSLAWSLTYDIGGQDSATDIENVQYDPSGVGGYIITGVTENRDERQCFGNRDVFLLRVDDCGNVLWVNTYGTAETSEIGWDVVEAQFGDDKCDARRGDFIVAGSTGFPGGPLSAYLLRVHDQANPNLVWTRTFHGPCSDGTEYFYGVTEAVTGVSGNAGDIIAVGGSSAYCQQGGGQIDALIVRVSACGNINAAPQGAAIYGGKYDDDLRSVVELTGPNCTGAIAATGRTEVADAAGNVGPEVYVILTKVDPCNLVANTTLGDGGIDPDEGYCIREVPNGHTDAGDLVVTGYMTLPGGFGREDVFIQRFKPCTLGTIAPVTHLYGGRDTDWGWSVNAVLSNPPCFSEGYIIAGFTSSFSNSQQLYLIKTDLGLKSGCNEKDVKAKVNFPKLNQACVKPNIERLGDECEPTIDLTCQTWETLLCYDADGTEPCFVERCCNGRAPKQNLSGTTIEMGDAGMVSTYPNPVKRGSILNLEYSLTKDADASVTVSDLTGKIVYTHAASLTAGTNVIPVNTSTWSTGSYIVNITIGGKSATRRIVVLDK